MPLNRDVHPYGVFFVPKTIQPDVGLEAGDILVSNFNNSANLQGFGTTILHVNAAGQTSTFYTASSTRVGLTAALGVLANGLVFIGNLPTSDGTSATAQAGNVSVLTGSGQFLGTIGNATTVGPWGMAVYDKRHRHCNRTRFKCVERQNHALHPDLYAHGTQRD